MQRNNPLLRMPKGILMTLRRAMLSVLLVLVGQFAVQAGDEKAWQSLCDSAATAYAEGRYQEALDSYAQVAEEAVSAALYYNMGNAAFKAGEIAPAMLYFERALRLDPGNRDIRFNRDMCQAYVVDRIEPIGEFILGRLVRAIGRWFSSDQWAVASLLLFALFLLGTAGFFFAKRRGLKKLSFSVGVISMVFSIFTLFYARSAYKSYAESDQAVVFSPSVTVKSSPDQNGTDLFLLHEGTKLTVKDTLGEWSEIELADGSVGWLESRCIVII